MSDIQVDVDDLTNSDMVKLGRAHVFEWLDLEIAKYADVKYNADLVDKLTSAMEEQGISKDSEWEAFILQYWSRAQIFGADMPQGRQALGKMIVTAINCLAQACLVYGDMPAPGINSGEIEEWKR